MSENCDIIVTLLSVLKSRCLSPPGGHFCKLQSGTGLVFILHFLLVQSC